jgi:hypothetical protein
MRSAHAATGQAAQAVISGSRCEVITRQCEVITRRCEVITRRACVNA